MKELYKAMKVVVRFLHEGELKRSFLKSEEQVECNAVLLLLSLYCDILDDTEILGVPHRAALTVSLSGTC